MMQVAAKNASPQFVEPEPVKALSFQADGIHVKTKKPSAQGQQKSSNTPSPS